MEIARITLNWNTKGFVFDTDFERKYDAEIKDLKMQLGMTVIEIRPKSYVNISD